MTHKETLPGGPPWDADTLVQVRVHKRGVEWVQTFDRVEGAKEALEREWTEKTTWTSS